MSKSARFFVRPPRATVLLRRLQEHLPGNIDSVLAALFAYRNKMFHCGFEWPVAERESFAKRIQDEGWPFGWFQHASHGERPWIFYMLHEFVNECQQTFEKVLNAFCELVKKHETIAGEIHR